MRTDPNKDKDFVYSKEWLSSGKLDFFDTDKNGNPVSNSFSGNERDSLYLNRGGNSFENVSAISGLDLVSDGRTFAYLDYDQDGWLDVALASANAPQLQLLRNEIGDSIKKQRNYVKLKLVGGNTSAKPSTTLSNRDGYGAKVIATLNNGIILYREHHCGAGMAAQNSSTIHIGIGDATSISELKIIWPSGRVQTIKNIKSGSIHEAFEKT